MAFANYTNINIAESPISDAIIEGTNNIHISSKNIILWVDNAHKKHFGYEDHPECPERINAIMKYIYGNDIYGNNIDVIIHQLGEYISPRSIIHNADRDPYWIVDEGDTYCTPHTPIILERAKSMIKDMVSTLCNGDAKCGFLLVRPPGHHAGPNGAPSGFCHQNNVWLAAQEFIKCGKKRIGILDWDVHHGDGTQAYVSEFENAQKIGIYTDCDIRFVSIHAYGRGIYPGTGDVTENTSKILNIPLKKGTKPLEYIKRFENDALQFLSNDEYKPDAIIISAGYDAHKDDPMKYLQLEESTYMHMSSKFKDIGCPIMFVLEGGYNPDVLVKCVDATLQPWL